MPDRVVIQSTIETAPALDGSGIVAALGVAMVTGCRVGQCRVMGRFGSKATTRLSSPLCGLPDSHISIRPLDFRTRRGSPLLEGEGQGEGCDLSESGALCTRGDSALDPGSSCPSPQPSPARERGPVALCRQWRCPPEICGHRSLCGGVWPPKVFGSGRGPARGERRCRTRFNPSCRPRLILNPGSPLAGLRPGPTPADAGATLPRRGGREERVGAHPPDPATPGASKGPRGRIGQC